jgi:hypothetical protein
MKLIDKVRSQFNFVESFRVTIIETCFADHPPSQREWSYSGDEDEGRDFFTHLELDKTARISGPFDLLMPVYSAARLRVAEKKGKVQNYFTDSGKTVTRSYVCEVSYRE